MHSPYWIDCQVAPPCMVWTLRTMSLTSDPGSYQINCCPYVPITWLLTNRRRVTSVALSPLNWTDVFVLCACLLRWELVNGLLNTLHNEITKGQLWIHVCKTNCNFRDLWKMLWHGCGLMTRVIRFTLDFYSLWSPVICSSPVICDAVKLVTSWLWHSWNWVTSWPGSYSLWVLKG